MQQLKQEAEAITEQKIQINCLSVLTVFGQNDPISYCCCCENCKSNPYCIWVGIRKLRKSHLEKTGDQTKPRSGRFRLVATTVSGPKD